MIRYVVLDDAVLAVNGDVYLSAAFLLTTLAFHTFLHFLVRWLCLCTLHYIPLSDACVSVPFFAFLRGMTVCLEEPSRLCLLCSGAWRSSTSHRWAAKGQAACCTQEGCQETCGLTPQGEQEEEEGCQHGNSNKPAHARAVCWGHACPDRLNESQEQLGCWFLTHAWYDACLQVQKHAMNVSAWHANIMLTDSINDCVLLVVSCVLHNRDDASERACCSAWLHTFILVLFLSVPSFCNMYSVNVLSSMLLYVMLAVPAPMKPMGHNKRDLKLCGIEAACMDNHRNRPAQAYANPAGYLVVLQSVLFSYSARHSPTILVNEGDGFQYWCFGQPTSLITFCRRQKSSFDEIHSIQNKGYNASRTSIVLLMFVVLRNNSPL